MDSRPSSKPSAPLREALEAAGHRYTPQRAAIYRTLADAHDHPTADDLFTAVRSEIPDLSLATVYKALEAFVGAGVAKKVNLGDGPARYDGRTEGHDHFRCLRCGSLFDVHGRHDPALLHSAHPGQGFEVVDYHLEIVGYCAACRG